MTSFEEAWCCVFDTHRGLFHTLLSAHRGVCKAGRTHWKCVIYGDTPDSAALFSRCASGSLEGTCWAFTHHLGPSNFWEPSKGPPCDVPESSQLIPTQAIFSLPSNERGTACGDLSSTPCVIGRLAASFGHWWPTPGRGCSEPPAEEGRLPLEQITGGHKPSDRPNRGWATPPPWIRAGL